MKITPREKKLIYFGSIVVAVVAIFYLIALLRPDRENNRAQQVETKKALLLRYRQMLSQEEVYQKRVEQYTAQLEQDMTRLLPGDNPNVAEADMQKLLKSFADQSGLEITRINTRPDEKVEDDFVKVSVSIEVSSDLAQLVRFLTEIQNYEKFLKIEQFQITGIQTQRRQQIRPSLTVVGYIRSKEPEANETPTESEAETDLPPAAVVEEPGD
jgi:type II secretory pathway component PulM